MIRSSQSIGAKQKHAVLHWRSCRKRELQQVWYLKSSEIYWPTSFADFSVFQGSPFMLPVIFDYQWNFLLRYPFHKLVLKIKVQSLKQNPYLRGLHYDSRISIKLGSTLEGLTSSSLDAWSLTLSSFFYNRKFNYCFEASIPSLQ